MKQPHPNLSLRLIKGNVNSDINMDLHKVMDSYEKSPGRNGPP